MPIDIEEFEDTNLVEFGEPCSPGQILSFLAEESNTAFKPSEIADQTDGNLNALLGVLSRLENRNLVRSKGAYWAITDDDERLAASWRFHLSMETLNDMYGEEDPEEWAPYAADFDG